MNTAAKQTVSTYTSAQCEAMRKAESRLPGIIHYLWEDNIIHGEDLLHLAPKGFAIFLTDIGDVLRSLERVGIVKPLRFSPSHSGAAFLGIDPSHCRPHLAPHAGDTAHWEWEVSGRFDVFDLVPQEERA